MSKGLIAVLLGVSAGFTMLDIAIFFRNLQPLVAQGEIETILDLTTNKFVEIAIISTIETIVLGFVIAILGLIGYVVVLGKGQ